MSTADKSDRKESPQEEDKPQTLQSDEDWKIQRDEAKKAGDEAFKTGNYETAIQHYSSALSLDPDHAVVLSNRSAAYLKSSQKSKALHDAQACVKIGTMGIKGISRLAAALQSLGRYEQAIKEWQTILEKDPSHAAAQKGIQDCQQAMPKTDEEQPNEQKDFGNQEDDDLDDFFNEVEETVETVKQEKIQAAQPKATNAIKNQKKDLGTAHQQIERILQKNYKFLNLNPFRVLDLSHDATNDEISRRYKALSLLLHPDKNSDEPMAQEAYDEVLKAKAVLDDEHKLSHVRQLCDEGMKQGMADYKKKSSPEESLESLQSKAIQRIFAQVEISRREVEQRQRSQEQRERQQEEDELQKERQSRVFDKEFRQEERVEKRIGNWRDFQKKKKKKT